MFKYHIKEAPLYLMNMNNRYEQQRHWLGSSQKELLTETQQQRPMVIEHSAGLVRSFGISYHCQSTT